MIRTPIYDIIARKILIHKEQLAYHHVDILLAIEHLLILLPSVVFGVHKRSKRLPMAPITLLNASPILHKRDIFETAVIGVDIILVASFADIEYPLIHAVDQHDSRSPSLPIHVLIHTHRTLDNGIAHVEIVKIIAGISENKRLIIRLFGPLIREKRIFETLLSETLIRIYG